MADNFFGVTTPESDPIKAIRTVNGILEGQNIDGEWAQLRGGGDR